MLKINKQRTRITTSTQKIKNKKTHKLEINIKAKQKHSKFQRLIQQKKLRPFS